jgi:hypothetical protein
MVVGGRSYIGLGVERALDCGWCLDELVVVSVYPSDWSWYVFPSIGVL